MTAPDLAEWRVVCLSPLPWAGLWTSRHELSRELARRGADVLFVDPPANALRPAGAAAAPPRPMPAGLRVVRPPAYLPYGVLARAAWLERRVVGHNADRYARFVTLANRDCDGDRRRVLLLNSFMPVLGHRVATRLRPDVHLYHRADELRSFASCQPLYLDLERTVAQEADVVVCVSEAIRDGIAGARPDALVVPNGVDNARFSNAGIDSRLTELPRPVAVLVGTVDGRVDATALQSVMAAGATLVVAGPVEPGVVPDGAVVLGPVEPSQVPAILAGADVGLVPYRCDWPGDVLKTYEYLAAGLPVVATDLPCLRREVAVIRSDAAGFGPAVRHAVMRDTPAGREHRRAVARRHDWSSRVDDLLDACGVAAA